MTTLLQEAATGAPANSIAPLFGARRHLPGSFNDPLHVGPAEVLALLGHEADPRACTDGTRFQVVRAARGSVLVHEATSADTIYVVRSGSFKCIKTAEDGYEHVLGFAWHGDVIGFDGLAGQRYVFAAVALEDSHVIALPRAALRALRLRFEGLDQALMSLAARQVAHAADIAEVMAAVSADARLARFLVQLSARMVERGQSPRWLLLRMTRRDIASYLGLAHETISRSLRALSDMGCLRVAERDVEIVDPLALRRVARATRGLADEDERLLARAA
jgi:CRP/FNR family transcriptional regulator, anaerobic regulatory protein